MYVFYDGWGVELKANVPTTNTIYIEPAVWDALLRYMQKHGFPPKILEEKS